MQLAEGDILLGKVSYSDEQRVEDRRIQRRRRMGYIDSITAPTGDQFPLWSDEPTRDSEGIIKLRSYHPPADQVTAKWGFLA